MILGRAVDHEGRTFTIPAATVALDQGERLALAIVTGSTFGWGGERIAYDLSPGCVDLGFVHGGRCPVLVDHLFMLSSYVGSVVRADVRTGELRCLCRIARTPAASEVWDLLADGHVLGISAGGQMQVDSDGLAVSAVVLVPGGALVFGTASATYINGGGEHIYAGGLDISAVVNGGAGQIIEFGATAINLIEQVAQLPLLAGLLVVHVDDAGDLAEVEAEPFAAQDESQPHAVAGVVHAAGPDAFGREQTAVLVETDRPVGHVELVGQLGDRPRPAGRRLLRPRGVDTSRARLRCSSRSRHPCTPLVSALP